MTSTVLTLKYYSDPAHGWLAVKRDLLSDLGIATKVSYYSYQKGQTVYLEQDRDMFMLIDALAERGVMVRFKEHHTDRPSRIRNYYHYLA